MHDVATAVQHMQVCRTRTDKRKLSSLELTLGHSAKSMPSSQESLALSEGPRSTMSTTVTSRTLCKKCGLDVAPHLGRLFSCPGYEAKFYVACV